MMPSPKKRRSRASIDPTMSAGSIMRYLPSRFLDVPLEVRELIYTFCNLGPYPKTPAKVCNQNENTHDQQPAKKKRRITQTIAPKKSKSTSKKQPKVQLWNPVTQCKHPLSHLSLGMVCRQVRNEYFPTFAKNHTFSICQPLIFANEYLSYTFPHQYSKLQHIKITIPTEHKGGDQRVCVALLHRCTIHPTHVYDNIDNYMKNLTKVFEGYPEILTNLQTLHIDVDGDANASEADIMREALFTNTLRLLNTIDKIIRKLSRKNEDLKQRQFVITPRSVTSHNNGYGAHTSCVPLELKIVALSTRSWTMVTDGQLIHGKTCNICDPADEHGWTWIDVEHEGLFWDLQRTLQRLEEAKLEHDDVPRDPKEKCWKVLFLSAHMKGEWKRAADTIKVGPWEGIGKRFLEIE